MIKITIKNTKKFTLSVLGLSSIAALTMRFYVQRLRRHGDIVKRSVGGFFLVQGRADDTMNLGGIKVHYFCPCVFHIYLILHKTGIVIVVKILNEVCKNIY